MARVFSSGFELQSLDNNFKEFVRCGTVSGVNSPGAISTSIKRSGAAALRINGSVPTFNDGIGVAQDTHAGSSNKKMWLRAYVLFEAFPSVNTAVMAIVDNTNIQNTLLTVSPTGVLQYWANIDPTSIGFTPTTSALNLHQWYRCEIFLDTTTGTSWSGEFRLDGTTICTFSGVNGGAFPCTIAQLIAFPYPTNTSDTGIDQYYDDVAANDANGTAQNSWPGEGKIVHLYPNAAGDNNAWNKSGGGAGDTNNFQNVDEITPDDVTTYVKRTTSGTPIDDYNCDSSASAGIGVNDTIKVIQVGARVGANSGTATSRDAKLRIKGQSGGTVQVGTTVFWNSINWITHSLGAPASYTLTSYTNPQGSVAWTPASIDTMQIGMQANTASINEIRVTSLWALVDYVPATSADLVPTSSLSSSAKLSAAVVTQLAAASSLAVNALEYNVASAALPCVATISVDARVYIPATAALPGAASLAVDIDAILLAVAVLPGTLNIAINAKFPNLTTTEMALTATLSFNTKALVSAPALLPADSSLLLNTKQNFVTAAQLICDSSLTLNVSLSIIARANFTSVSSLVANTTQFNISAATLVVTSTLLAATLHFLDSGSLVLATSSSLQADTVPKFSSSAIIVMSSDLRADTLQKSNISAGFDLSVGLQLLNTLMKWNSSSVISASTSVQVQAGQNWRSTASLAASSSLTADSAKYIPATVVVAASSSLAANTLWYPAAIATLASTSAWVVQALNIFQITSTLPANSVVFANILRYIPTVAALTATSNLVTDAQRYTLTSSAFSINSSLSANALRYVPAVAVLADSSNLAVTTIGWLAAPAVLACSSSLTSATTQTIKHIAVAELPSTSGLSAKASIILTCQPGVLSLNSDIKVSFTPLFSFASIVLFGTSTLAGNTTLKDRNISASLFGTTALLANAAQYLVLQSSYTLSSNLSVLALQRWSDKSQFDLISNIKAALIQKMFETSKWALTSQCAARAINFVSSKSNIIVLSDLRVNTIIHQVENHNKTQKHLRGNLERISLKAGTAEEIEEVA